jgi:hypothetical protein
LNAQWLDNFENILNAGENDAKLLADAYFQPLGQSFTYSLNNGWASSAKTHYKFGFDITIGATFPKVPDQQKSFNIQSLGLSSSLTSNSLKASTLFGDKSPTNFEYAVIGSSVSKIFRLPGGIEEELIGKSFATPYLQVGIGLIFDTDLIIRYVPNINSQGMEVTNYGLGLKHNLIQYFGLLDKFPVNVAALVSYSKLNAQYSLDKSSPYKKIEYGVNTIGAQLMASVDLPFLSFIAAAGYGKGDAHMNMLGTYSLPSSSNNPTIFNNPISLDQSFSGMHSMLGLRFNLLFFKTFLQYTFQDYNTLNFGVSLNLR